MGWFTRENAEFPLSLYGLSGRATVEQATDRWFAEVSLELGPAPDESSAEPIDETDAARMVEYVFGLEPVTTTEGDTSLLSSLIVTGPKSELGVEAQLLTQSNDGLHSVGTQPVRLLPKIPVSQARYWAFLKAVRATWSEAPPAYPSVGRLLDSELLNAPELQTFDHFRAVVLDDGETVRRLAGRAIERLFPDAPPLTEDQTMALYRLHPECAVDRADPTPAAESIDQLPDHLLERVVEAWVERLSETPQLALEDVHGEVIGGIKERIGDAVETAAQRYLEEKGTLTRQSVLSYSAASK